MEIKIEQVTSWKRAMNAARWTMGLDEMYNEPQRNFKTWILLAEHSPIRLVEYDIKIKGIPYCNAVHFVRHHIGVEKFQCTLRDDRNREIDDRKKLPQDYPVNLWISANANALISISRKRLCNRAETVTRTIWQNVRKELRKVDPVMASYMVRECIYRGGCPEKPCCGYINTENYHIARDNYWEGFTQA